MADLAPGTVVAGYRIEALVGRGGMGVVYRAQQPSLQRPVALKVIAPELLDDPGARERFLAEAQAAASRRGPRHVPGQAPPALCAFDPGHGVTTPSYNTAIVAVNRGAFPYGGLDLARLLDGDEEVAGTLGGTGAATFGLRVGTDRTRYGPRAHRPGASSLRLVRAPGVAVAATASTALRAFAGPFRDLRVRARRSRSSSRAHGSARAWFRAEQHAPARCCGPNRLSNAAAEGRTSRADRSGCDDPSVIVAALVLAGVLIVVLAVVGERLRRARARADAAEAENARLVAELLRREREVTELTPFRARVERAPDWIWTADAGGTVTYSNTAALPVGSTVEQPGRSGVVQRGGRTVDTRSVALDAGWLGVDRDMTEAVPARVAIVRRPVVDGRREVVGYELVGDGSVLASFPPGELVALAAGRPLWLSLDGEVAPELAAHGLTLQLAAGTSVERARALRAAGFTLALDGYEGASPLLDECQTVKVRADGRSDEELRALIAEPAARGLELVATDVDDADEFTRCRVLGFSHFQGAFFARPRGGDGPGTGALASLQALGELTAADPSFEDLERIIGADVGLSLALIRHVNSAYFALPRKIDSVREALTLLGTRAVRRWATVVALTGAADAPDQVVALALLRARMCELLGSGADEDDRDGLFTVGLFSVADALLDAPMEDVLASLPLSDEITGALLRHEGRRGRILGTVLRYEQGRFPTDGADPAELAEAYLDALRWADDTGRWLA